MENTFVISGLVKRRATLSGDIGRMQRRLKQMLRDLEALDATIRLFDADYPIEAIKAKERRPPSNWTTRGEFTRLIFNVLRQASEPLSTRDIAREVMALKRMDIADLRAVTSMRERVGYILRKKRRSGDLRSHQGPDQLMFWELAFPIRPLSAASTLSTAC